MLTNVSNSVFLNSESIGLTPVVSAEWNHNLFNPPYLTTAGSGVSIAKSLTSGTVQDVTVGAKANFSTKSFQANLGSGSVTYTVPSAGGKAYKIVTYVKTNTDTPLMFTAFAKGATNQYGSSHAEADSIGWTKIITYIAGSATTSEDYVVTPETISSFTYTIFTNPVNGFFSDAIVYFTVPEIYETTYYDYRNNSLWPTDSAFTYFRPGESYIFSGDARCVAPSLYRKINSSIIANYSSPTYSPVSAIVQNPQFFLASPPVPVLKTALPSSISSYKYFVSDNNSRSITGIYESAILSNKIVIKFNTVMTIPSVNIYVNGNMITVDGFTAIVPPNNSDNKCPGILVLYWTGSSWTKTKWSTPPKFNSVGELSLSTPITKLTVTQVTKQTNSEFTSYSSQYVQADLNRMQLVEVSPRLEIDLTDFVESVTINKSLDSQSSVLPISSLNTNDASLNFSGIPAVNGSTIVPILSMNSSQSSTILSNIMRKNVKFYVGYVLSSYADAGSTPVSPNTYIPGGVFYSDNWREDDINTVTVQSYDSSRYLQSLQVSDYVANLKTAFDVITNLLDLSGFTDYDYDSLHQICNDRTSPMDLAYYYCNSQDTTVIEALNQIFISYQIGAYIDEYGIMKFLSLKNILSNQSSNMSLSDSNIAHNGYSSSIDAKPGKVSLRYQTPKIKQSPSLQNVANIDIKNSPSFVYTTSNDVVWQQQTIDSVGFNYLNENMSASANMYNLNVNDLLDIFHTFNLSANGYVFIDNEILSFDDKEYSISNDITSDTVDVKNNLELTAEINKFIKKNGAQLRTSYSQITNAVGNQTSVTYTGTNNFKVGDKIMVTGVTPSSYNIHGKITSRTSTSFTVPKYYNDQPTGTYVRGGQATIFADYDVTVTPSGNITNVKRGLFGTYPKAHNKITTLASKGLQEGVMSSSFVPSVSTGNTSVVNNNVYDDSLPDLLKIRVRSTGSNKTMIYSPLEKNEGYRTYSAKFDMDNQDVSAAGIFFNMTSPTNDGNTYFVELIRYNTFNPKSYNPLTGTLNLYSPPRYRYVIVIYDSNGDVYAWSNVTGECNSIVANFTKILKKDESGASSSYSYVTDNAFNLKVVRNLSDGSDGENASTSSPKEVISVFINNVEISGWLIPGELYDEETNPDGSGWKATEINPFTGMRQKPTILNNVLEDTLFGFYATLEPVVITDLNPAIVYPEPTSSYPAYLREIHATKKALSERSVSYFYQDREFLNGLIQDQPLYNLSPTYMMQTTPEVVGINTYDVQYMTPAAVSVDVLPIEYKMDYYPGESPQDQKNYQVKFVDEYSLSYSTPINTGFRGKIAVANNSPHLVFLSKESDAIEGVTVNFNLWTHEIIAPSDPEILEVVIDPGNKSEVVQLDSEWIQSKNAAVKMLSLIEKSIDGFSKNVTLKVFGNPLVQVGDTINLSYSLKGITNQRYLVHSVSNTFSNGLETELSLKRLS